ncbi:unnamed protein product [Paramecium octaurelia]|uniref:Uncharacterized protein n=1 Tax=Paramecium octaurelia TaxID=43137 RepID=A0A8S1TAL6_PAROT|nr:unnamed protein product [Paramecium octaurelia]
MIFNEEGLKQYISLNTQLHKFNREDYNFWDIEELRRQPSQQGKWQSDIQLLFLSKSIIVTKQIIKDINTDLLHIQDLNRYLIVLSSLRILKVINKERLQIRQLNIIHFIVITQKRNRECQLRKSCSGCYFKFRKVMKLGRIYVEFLFVP